MGPVGDERSDDGVGVVERKGVVVELGQVGESVVVAGPARRRQKSVRVQETKGR